MQRLDIIGFIGRDAEVKDFNTDQVINFSVAVTESYKDKNGVKQTKSTWYEVSKWGNNTAIAQYLKKGTLVMVTGKPNARIWTKDGGEHNIILTIQAQNIQLLGGGKTENKEQPTPQPNTQVNTSQEDDGIPF